MKPLLNTIIWMTLINGLSVAALADFKDVCTISGVCAPDERFYYILFAETRMVKILDGQDVELSYCAIDSWKATQAVSYLKSQAKKLVANGSCKTIVNRTRY